MNQEKLIQSDTPSIPPLSIQTALYSVPTRINVTNTISKNAIDEFLYLSRMYLGLDKTP